MNELTNKIDYLQLDQKNEQSKEKIGRIKERRGKRPIKTSKILYIKLKVAVLKYAIFQRNSSKTLLHLIA